MWKKLMRKYLVILYDNENNAELLIILSSKNLEKVKIDLGKYLEEFRQEFLYHSKIYIDITDPIENVKEIFSWFI